ncbi:hypothetical protein WJX74_003475 [Apatococcus lobatus]|uniref:IQ motif and ubiquitin-like domain-containing protein n=1 Tax=Apatococcus lobatus TaxID=904363 RepID=A0AAW1RC00_9CHLO
MNRRDLVIDTSGDRLLTPRPYKSSAAWMTTREAATLVLQRWVKKLRAAWLLAEAMRLDELARTKSEEEQRAFAEMQRRIHPHLKSDFAILQAELAAWVAAETNRIHAKLLPQTYHQAAMQQLLYKETRLLQAIGRLQAKAQKETKAAAVEATLDGMAAPKAWSLSNGATAFVSTPESMRAGELNQLYREYQQQAKSLRQRAEVLLKVKLAVKELVGGPGAELRQLIDREADMLARGRSEASLFGLRSRAKALLLQLLQTATFNPLAASIQGPARKPENFMYGALPVSQAA